MTELNEYLDYLGENPVLYKLYTQVAFCWPIPDASLHSSVVQTLRNGLERLSKDFPWVAGQVVDEGNGGFRIRAYEPIPQLIIKDYRDDASVPDWDTLKAARFPMHMLDESIVCPRTTLPDPTAEAAPILQLQINWIKNGMILTINMQHNVVDFTGQEAVIEFLSRACHKATFTDEEIRKGNPDRRAVFSLHEETWKPDPESVVQQRKPGAATPSPPPPSSWSYFLFSGEALAALKQRATASLTSGFVSTDDVLTAYIWQSVMRVRLPRLDPSDEVQFARAVDARRYMGAPLDYPGVCQNMAFSKSNLGQHISGPLGLIAAAMRAAVDLNLSDIEARTRALATLMSRTEQKTALNFMAGMDFAKDIQLSSWVKYPCYEQDFNFGLGRPEAIRRPRFFAMESLFYLMPKRPNGEVAAALCLRDEDLERLRADEDFAQYATYIG
jgi:trichothecene 3-O-acetyltransferase